MAKDLIIGSAGLRDIEDSICRFIRARGHRIEIDRWASRPDTIVALSSLNSASVLEFLRHSIAVEGFVDEGAGFRAGEKGELLKNFPWWDNAVWLPIGFEDVGVLDDDATLFVGSCQSLISELDALNQKSPIKMDQIVPSYENMRADFESFVSDGDELGLPTHEQICWVWRSLRDGAELAIKEDAVLWSGPD